VTGRQAKLSIMFVALSGVLLPFDAQAKQRNDVQALPAGIERQVTAKGLRRHTPSRLAGILLGRCGSKT
jgi:hypothetical protein